MMRPIATACVAALLAATGCTTHRNFVMSDTAILGAESHGLWTRPVELGYEIVGDVQGEADATTVLGIGGGGLSPIARVLLLVPMSFAAFLVDAPPRVDRLAGNATFAAVDAAGADALYVTRYEETTTGFLFFYKHRHAVVYGKALRMQDFGVVDMKRADRLRIPDDAKIVIRATGGIPDLKAPGEDLDEAPPE